MKSLINTLKNNFNYVIISSFVLLTLTQCSKSDDEPEVINEEETTTTVEFTFQKAGETSATTVTYEEGQSIPSITLDANSTYSASVAFYNKTNPDDIENVTEEVIEEVDEHQIFYQIAGSVTITSASSDILDSSNNPLMVNTDWATGAASTGSVQIYLIHEPITKTGSTRDDFDGSTDIQVNFPVTIQ